MDMKVMFATDFYASSTTARALLTQLPWPARSRLEMLHVLTPPRRSSMFAARLGHDAQVLEEAARQLRAFAIELAARVEESRGAMQYTIRVGDPAETILDHVLATEPDLVVLGGPGRAESVSGEMSPLSATVVREAACSVLVARSDRFDELVLADDDAGNGESADSISRWPLFRALFASRAAAGRLGRARPSEWSSERAGAARIEASVGQSRGHASRFAASETDVETDDGLAFASVGSNRLVVVPADAVRDHATEQRVRTFASIRDSVLIARGRLESLDG
jgi:nucleotide-binding universal stress UspA family protein